MLAAAFVLFVVGSIFAVRGLPDVEQEPRWELLAVVALVGVPLALALNAAEYQVTAAIVAGRVPFAAALRVGVLATAANLLPVPGAVLVRAHAMRGLGASYGKIALATGAVGLCFVGVPCLAASGLLAASGQPVFAALLAAAGVLLLAVALALLTVELGSRTGVRLVLAAAARAAGAVLVKAGRVYLILIALGYEAGATEALTLTIGAVIATALGFVPAGLGVAEGLSAALSPLVGLSAAVGFVATAVDRLISMVGLALIGGGMLLLERRSGKTAGREPEPTLASSAGTPARQRGDR